MQETRRTFGSVGTMSWARDEVLFQAQCGLFGLRAVQNLVCRESRSANEQGHPEAIQLALVDLVRSLVHEGLAVIGAHTGRIRAVDNPRRRRTRRPRRLAAADRGGPRSGSGCARGRRRRPAGQRPVKKWDWPFAQAAARVLVYGTIDWIELGQIHWRVKEVSPDMPIDVVQQRTLELIAELVRGGLVVVGSIDTGAYRVRGVGMHGGGGAEPHPRRVCRSVRRRVRVGMGLPAGVDPQGHSARPHDRSPGAALSGKLRRL